jgi:hypothetical protein
MKCRDCQFLSEPKEENDDFPSVRCTLGIWDKNSPNGDIKQWYSYGSSQLNRGPVKVMGDLCKKGKSKK